MTTATPPALLDLRPPADYDRLHRAGAVNVPWEELPLRMYELPSRITPLMLYDFSEERVRAAEKELQQRGRCIGQVYFGEGWLQSGPTESGPSRRHLWQPHELLLTAMDQARPAWNGVTNRRALDMACGTGRDAVFLALQGFSVWACDVLPDAVQRCADLAGRHGVNVQGFVCDVRTLTRIESGPFDWVSCFYFLHRPLIPLLREAVIPGGFLVYETFVVPQRQTYGKPAREADVLKPDELRRAFADWDIRCYTEGEVEPRRIAARLIARRPG